MPYIKLIVLFCFSSTALCANWVEAGGDIYVDVESIRKHRGVVSYSSLENMTTMGLNSMVIMNEANCSEAKVTELNIWYYGQPMGRGELVEKKVSNKIKLLEQNTKEYLAMKFACTQE